MLDLEKVQPFLSRKPQTPAEIALASGLNEADIAETLRWARLRGQVAFAERCWEDRDLPFRYAAKGR